MRVLVSVMPFAGHVRPFAQLVATMVHRGHEVTVCTGAAYGPRLEAAGAQVREWQAAPDFDETQLSATFPEVGRRGPLGLLTNLEHVFVRTAAGQATDLVTELDRATYDVVVGDTLSLGTGLAAELRGRPWASVAIVPNGLPTLDLPPPGLRLAPRPGRLGRTRDRALWSLFRLGTRRLEVAHRQQRRLLGLSSTGRRIEDAWYSPELILQTGCADLDYPRTDLPASFTFVGRLGPDPGPREMTPPDRPRVLLTQGTYNTDPADLLAPGLAGLASLDVEVIATTGRRGDLDVGVPVPANARVHDFVDFAEILPATTVVISNGGWGGVLDTLSAGVPLVVAGSDLDKPEIAARVAWSGAGIDLRTGRPTAIQVRNAVSRVLAEPSFSRRSREIAAELRSLGGAEAATSALERFAAQAA